MIIYSRDQGTNSYVLFNSGCKTGLTSRSSSLLQALFLHLSINSVKGFNGQQKMWHILLKCLCYSPVLVRMPTWPAWLKIRLTVNFSSLKLWNTSPFFWCLLALGCGGHLKQFFLSRLFVTPVHGYSGRLLPPPLPSMFCASLLTLRSVGSWAPALFSQDSNFKHECTTMTRPQ